MSKDELTGRLSSHAGGCMADTLMHMKLPPMHCVSGENADGVVAADWIPYATEAEGFGEGVWDDGQQGG